MEHVSKFYGRVQALNDVSVTIDHNEIVGLLGDNGAGKSTLIKILSGVTPLSSGDIYIRGQKVSINDTNDAIALGIETIYQDSALVNQLSIARNLFLGREPIKGPAILNRMDTQVMDDVARRLLTEVGITKSIPPTTPISSLSGGERQAVAIARAVHFNARILIMDEPTAALGPAETAQVRALIKQLEKEGIGIFLISHDIHDVFDLSHRIAVMYHGKIVGIVNRDDVTPDDVLGMIIMGKALDEVTTEERAKLH